MTNDNAAPTSEPTTAEEQPRPTRAAICIPSSDTWKADTSMAVAGLLSLSSINGVACALVNEKSSMITKARNSLAERSLDLGADYVLYIDSDLVFPPDALVRLLNHNLDIVGATYNKRVPPYETLGHFLGPVRDLSTGGLIEADFLPGGFLLVKASVFRALPKPWFFETYYRSPSEPIAGLTGLLDDQYSELLNQPVREAIGRSVELNAWAMSHSSGPEFDSLYMSEDYNFCRKARKHGFQIWCDLDLVKQMSHIGEQHVTCQFVPPGTVVAPEAAAPGQQNIDLSAASAA